jgi:CMP-N,N'-diacetyllegionaminic acid synthase
MIDGKKVLGLIPARGGSKGIPRKNIRLLSGRPLIAWTIEEAKKSLYIDRIIVSTEDNEIAEIAKEYGAEVPFFRPAELATDNARGIDVVLHALREIPDYGILVLLQPTSPLRKAEDIDSSLNIYSKYKKSVVSVTEVSRTPYWMYTVQSDLSLKEVLSKPVEAANRQDLPTIYILNGMVYVSDRETIKTYETLTPPGALAYIVEPNRSIDIDTESDWNQAELFLKK